MAKFGRPFWLAYGRPDHIARIKIIGGSPSRAYDAYNEIPVSRTRLDSVDPSTGIMFTQANQFLPTPRCNICAVVRAGPSLCGHSLLNFSIMG